MNELPELNTGIELSRDDVYGANDGFNIENHVSVVGWKNIEALELVVHGPALRTFLAKDMDPDVRGKLETLMAGGLRFDACQNTMARQKIEVKDLIEGVTPTETQFSYEDVSATLRQYGQVVVVTDKIEDLHEDPVLNDASMQAGENIGRSAWKLPSS